jgi:hypothetical protein
MFKTRVITDANQVPAGYIPMADLCKLHGEPAARALSDAHTQGKVQALKLMRTPNDRSGPVWLEERGANKVVQANKPKPHTTPEYQAKVQGTRPKNESPWDELASMSWTLLSIDTNLGRVAESMEAMLKVQQQALASMQRLETAWSAAERSS